MANTCMAPQNSSFESDSAFESDEMMDFDELDCSDPLAMSGRCPFHEGLRIEISEHPHRMKKVANVVIILQKDERGSKFPLRSSSSPQKSVVMRVNCDSSKTYNQQNKVIQCTVCDSLKKNLVRSQFLPMLLAVTLKAPNIDQSVSFNLSTYTTPGCADDKGQPVCLRIAQSNLYLSCTKESESSSQPRLEVNDTETLRTVTRNDDMERFLFRQKVTGVSTNTFESVKYSGWFISTSKKESTPVEMCKEEDTTRQKAFSLQNPKVIQESDLISDLRI
ncbi:hypothetical protein NFI96_017513 [Prochilodus magdalenae]|nr:hypothetical protein NFI96_017513 [Prochilodus magdalenae]